MQNELCIMDATGDTKVLFDPNNRDEVEAAEATFNKLKKKGYIAYSVDKGGEKGEIMTAFDAKAGKIILTPPMVGG